MFLCLSVHSKSVAYLWNVILLIFNVDTVGFLYLYK